MCLNLWGWAEHAGLPSSGASAGHGPPDQDYLPGGCLGPTADPPNPNSCGGAGHLCFVKVFVGGSDATPRL